MKRVIPQVPALDVRASLDFYSEKLGFGDRWMYDEHYGGVRIPFELHFSHYADAAFPQNYVMRFEVDDIAGQYQRCRQHGIVHPNGPLEHKPWGLQEFAVLDPSGVLIVFFQRSPEAPEPRPLP